jgi:hypothetical protein
MKNFSQEITTRNRKRRQEGMEGIVNYAYSFAFYFILDMKLILYPTRVGFLMKRFEFPNYLSISWNEVILNKNRRADKLFNSKSGGRNEKKWNDMDITRSVLLPFHTERILSFWRKKTTDIRGCHQHQGDLRAQVIPQRDSNPLHPERGGLGGESPNITHLAPGGGEE